jgi:hypothetical protein
LISGKHHLLSRLFKTEILRPCADDDKGQSFIHAKAFEYMVKTNTLPCNVKFIIEGEEEIGSPQPGKIL